MSNSPGTDYRIDDIDRRIIHALMGDARTTSAPMIAEQVNVSPGTIRNRINQLRELGIVRGYHASIDFERADHKQTFLYICSVPPGEVERVAREARTISGVINVRELISGTRNLHVVAVGETTADFKHIMRSLADLDVDVLDKSLMQNEHFEPYSLYGPDDAAPPWKPADFVHLSGGADIVEVTVTADAPIVNRSLEEAAESGILDEDILIVAVERDGRVLTPRGETVIKRDDVVTLVSRGTEPDEMLVPFRHVVERGT